MWIKICANTNLEDAALAAELRADAVGFVFAPSKRKVTPLQVATIVAALPQDVEKIGVFPALDAVEIAAIVRATGLTGVQLHGSFDLELASQLRDELGEDIALIQVVHWKVDGDPSHAEQVTKKLEAIAAQPAIDRVLIDSKTAKGTGGTGINFDWAAAHGVLAGFQGKLIVAGGLRPQNVSAAIEALQPWGVDVASGVESEPGKKDAAKLRSFIENSR